MGSKLGGGPTLGSMHADVLVADLVTALGRAASVIVPTPTMMAYTGAYLVVAENTVNVYGSDGDTTVTTTINTQGSTVGGSVLLTPKALLSWLKTLTPSDSVTLTVDTVSELSVTSTGSSDPYTFRTLSATFPLPGKAENITATDLSDLVAALSAVATSAGAADDATRDDVVHVVSTPTSLTLYSTDQFRVTRATLPGASIGDVSFLMRLKTLQLITKWKPVGIRVEPTGTVTADVGNGTVSVRKLDGVFPPAEQIVSAPAANKTTFDGADAHSALKRLSAVAGEGETLLVTVDGEALTLSVDAEHVGSGKETLPISCATPDAVTFGVNVDFFSQALHACNAETVTIEWTSAMMPVRVSSLEPVNVAVVVMPVRLADA
jgi:DNA polymerase III sliding clamp (beta) subunit (PCNA family)